MCRWRRACRARQRLKWRRRWPCCRLVGRKLSRAGAGAALPARGKRVCRRELRHHGPVHQRQRQGESCAAAGLPRPELQAGADSGSRGAGDCQHDGEALGGGRRLSDAAAESEAACAVIASHKPGVKFLRDCTLEDLDKWGNEMEPKSYLRAQARDQRKPAHRGRVRRAAAAAT